MGSMCVHSSNDFHYFTNQNIAEECIATKGTVTQSNVPPRRQTISDRTLSITRT